MKKNLEILRQHLADESGDENITKMIWVAIVFVVGAIVLAFVVAAFKGPVKNWYDAVIDKWFNGANGGYDIPDME